MKCSTILERSIQYLDDALGEKEKLDFEVHIDRCEACNKKYLLISSNYDTTINLESVPSDFKESLMIKMKEYKNSTFQPKIMKPKAVLLSICLLIGITATVFAKPLYKSLEQLIQGLGREVDMEFLSAPASRCISAELIAEERAKEIFIKNQEHIESIINHMKVGEVKSLQYKDGKDILKIRVGIGSKSRSIGYAMNNSGGFRMIEGIEYLESREKFYTAQKKVLHKLIDNGYFVPAIQGLEQEYKLAHIFTKHNDIPKMKAVDSLIYENRLGLQSVELNFNDENIIKNADFKRSLEEVNGLQAIYEQGELHGKAYSRLHIILGEDKRQKVLTIGEYLTPGSLTKEELLKIARSIRFFNVQNNNPSREDQILYVDTNKEFKMLVEEKEEFSYEQISLKDFRDPRIRKVTDAYISRVQKRERKFTMNPASDITLTRRAGAFLIEYKRPDYEDMLRWYKLPLFIYKDLYEHSVIDSVLVAGGEKQDISDINIIYRFKEQGDKESNEKEVSNFSVYMSENLNPYKDSIHKYPILDIMIDQFVSSSPMQQIYLVYDEENHPYIIRDGYQGIICISTIKKINGKYIEYGMNLPRAFVDEVGMDKFVRGFKIIK